jgi:MFS family permease
MKSENKGPVPSRGVPLLLRALQYKNYRLFFGGQAISLIGTWMQSTAMGWLVYRLTGSELLLGLVAFAGQVPAFLATPLGGLVADRWDRRRMLILTQSLCMAQACVLTILYFTGCLNIPWILALTAFVGLVNAFDIPIRHSFVPEMIEKREDLGNAIALNSSLFNGARLLGPALAGLLIQIRGEGICFFINALSFIAVVLAFWAMKTNSNHPKSLNKNVLEGLKEGLKYVAGNPPIRSILLILCLICFIPFTVLLPVFAKLVLHGGPHTYGFLLGASGLGALMGAIFLASRSDARGLVKIIALGGIVFGLGLVAASFVSSPQISLLLAVFIGFGMMVTMAASNTVLQTISDDDKRGRVMSFYTMTFVGTAPLGSLAGGWFAKWKGVPDTYLLCGIACLIGAIIFAGKVPALEKMVRRVIGKKDSESRIAAGREAATELTQPPEE